MTTYVISVAVTVMLYALLSYVSYIASFILYKGICYRLIVPTAKALVFLITSYTSIIADIFLFSQGELYLVIIKNTIFILVLISSYLYAKMKEGD